MGLGLLLHEENDDHARDMISRAAEIAREIGFYRAEAWGLAVLARIQREAGETEQADTTSAAALELVERHGSELTDRITVVGTRALVLREAGERARARRLRRGLEARIARGARRIEDRRLRRDLEDYARRLLRAVLSQEGPVLPRMEEPGPERVG
jgi:hypothetical protein